MERCDGPTRILPIASATLIWRCRPDHRGPVSTYRAELSYGVPHAGVRPVIHGEAHLVPPENPADYRAWLSGLRDARIDADNVPLSVLNDVLPRIALASGTGVVHASVQRATPDGPLLPVVGVDLRNVQLLGNLARALPASLGSLVRTSSAPTPPFTEPLRFRAALCGVIEDNDVAVLPVTTSATLGREAGEPVVPPPTACTDQETRSSSSSCTREAPWGPWHRGITHALAEFRQSGATLATASDVTLSSDTRNALRSSPVDLTVAVGPLNRDDWPFTDRIILLFPRLHRPRSDAESHVAVHVSRNLFSPVVRASGALRSTGWEQLLTRDRLAMEGTVDLEPTVPGESLFGPVHIVASADGSLSAPTAQAPLATARAQLVARATGSALIDPEDAYESAHIDQFVLNTTDFPLGHLRWARGNNIDGSLELAMRETGDDASPIAATASVTNLRVRTPQSMRADASARVHNNAGHLELDACALMREATTAATCDPDGPADTVADHALHARVALPFANHRLSISPDWTNARVEMAAQDFRIDARVAVARGVAHRAHRWVGHVACPMDCGRSEGLSAGTLPCGMVWSKWNRWGFRFARSSSTPTRSGTAPRCRVLRFVSELGPRKGTAPVTFQPAGNNVVAMNLEATTDQLPAEQEGSLYGYVTSVLRYNGMFRTNGHAGTLDVTRASVSVPNQASRDLQGLGGRADVFVIGETHRRGECDLARIPDRHRFCDAFAGVGAARRLRDIRRVARARSLRRGRRRAERRARGRQSSGLGGPVRQAVLLRPHWHGVRRIDQLQPQPRRSSALRLAHRGEDRSDGDGSIHVARDHVLVGGQPQPLAG